MAGVARINDMVSCTCCCHPPTPCIGTVGFFVQSAVTVNANGLGVVRLGDMAMCVCGHPTFVVGGSSTVLAEGIGVARLGDAVSGCPVGTIVTSSSDVIAS